MCLYHLLFLNNVSKTSWLAYKSYVILWHLLTMKADPELKIWLKVKKFET